MPSVSPTIWMITENAHKFAEAKTILAKYGIVLRAKKLSKVELQSPGLGQIASHALSQVPSKFRRQHMTLVEDSGLFIETLHGFPGPYSSYAHATIGVKGVLDLLGETRRRRAYFESAVALSTNKGSSRLFIGRVWGRISSKPRGTNGFGFDPIFIPDGSIRTNAEVSEGLKNLRSHRAVALEKLAAWLVRKHL